MFILNDNLKINNALVARTSKLSRFFSVFGQRVVKTSMSLGSWFELQRVTYTPPPPPSKFQAASRLVTYNMYVYNKILLKIIELEFH